MSNYPGILKTEKKFGMFAAQDKLAVRNDKDNDPEHKWRSKFERDRDRILYSRSFHRLFGKTQVFVFGTDDHIRNRLTHTLEVHQIASTLAKRLGLNIPLCEAIAYGHDLGHTPYGHVGERTLNYIMNGCIILDDFNIKLNGTGKGFKHNWQSVRVITELENYDIAFKGLNCTDYTLWGILYHSNTKWKKCDRFDVNENCIFTKRGVTCKNQGQTDVSYYENNYLGFFKDDSWTLEAFIVKWADDIAQRHHDVVDAIEAGIMDSDQVIQTLENSFKEDIKGYKDKLQKIKSKKTLDKQYIIASFSKWIVNFYVNKICDLFGYKLVELSNINALKRSEDFYYYKKEINNETASTIFSFRENSFVDSNNHFAVELKDYVLNSHNAQIMDGRADYIIRKLFAAYLTNPQQLPDLQIEKLSVIMGITDGGNIGQIRNVINDYHYKKYSIEYQNNLCRVICDYIAGMTDSYAMKQYQSLYGISLQKQ